MWPSIRRVMLWFLSSFTKDKIVSPRGLKNGDYCFTRKKDFFQIVEEMCLLCVAPRLWSTALWHTEHTAASCLASLALALPRRGLLKLNPPVVWFFFFFLPFCSFKTHASFDAWEFANVFLITSNSNRTFPSSRPWINPFSLTPLLLSLTSLFSA